MRSLLGPILALLLAARAAGAGELPAAAALTERGRGLPAALDRLLAGDGSSPGRTVWLLLDPTPSLQTARFPEELSAALGRSARFLTGTRIGLAVAGEEGPPALAPTADAAALVAAVEKALAAPKDAFRNLYADLRRLAGSFPGDGAREILLVSLENGDGEDEVEATAALLARGGIRVSAVAREAFLSDTYWVPRATQAPRGFEMAGGESAFIEVPWGWLFEQGLANEEVPSGFAMYGITRIATVTGGSVFLFYPPSLADAQCSRYGSCPFCASDHIGCHEPYQNHRLRALSPLAGSRNEVYATAARDAYLQAVLRAWERAEKAGLLRSRPSVRLAGGTLRPERRMVGSAEPLGSSLGLPGQIQKAERLAKDAEKIAADLAEETERAAAAGGSDRYRAIAELTRVQILLTRVNLLAFAAFCREVAPGLLEISKAGGQDEPPERWTWPEDYRFTGIGFTEIPLCHGVKPFHDLHLPGGEEFERELSSFAPVVEGYLARHAGTPFAEAVRRSGIARFWLSGVGRTVNPVPRPITGSETDSAATGAKERPARAGGGSGSGGGATSGSDR